MRVLPVIEIRFDLYFWKPSQGFCFFATKHKKSELFWVVERQERVSHKRTLFLSAFYLWNLTYGDHAYSPIIREKSCLPEFHLVLEFLRSILLRCHWGSVTRLHGQENKLPAECRQNNSRMCRPRWVASLAWWRSQSRIREAEKTPSLQFFPLLCSVFLPFYLFVSFLFGPDCWWEKTRRNQMSMLFVRATKHASDQVYLYQSYLGSQISINFQWANSYLNLGQESAIHCLYWLNRDLYSAETDPPNDLYTKYERQCCMLMEKSSNFTRDPWSIEITESRADRKRDYIHLKFISVSIIILTSLLAINLICLMLRYLALFFFHPRSCAFVRLIKNYNTKNFFGHQLHKRWFQLIQTVHLRCRFWAFDVQGTLFWSSCSLSPKISENKTHLSFLTPHSFLLAVYPFPRIIWKFVCFCSVCRRGIQTCESWCSVVVCMCKFCHST